MNVNVAVNHVHIVTHHAVILQIKWSFDIAEHCQSFDIVSFQLFMIKHVKSRHTFTPKYLMIFCLL